jgi:hypothetical protein
VQQPQQQQPLSERLKAALGFRGAGAEHMRCSTPCIIAPAAGIAHGRAADAMLLGSVPLTLIHGA